MTERPEQPPDVPRPASYDPPVDYPDDLPPTPGYPPYPPYPPYPSYPPSYPPPSGYPPAAPSYPPPYPGGPAAYPGYPGGYDPYRPGTPPGTNGMAIASLVTSLAGLFFCGAPSVVGMILGIVAMGQCRRTGQEGHGMALAGTIVGAAITVVAVIGFVIWVAAMVAVPSTY